MRLRYDLLVPASRLATGWGVEPAAAGAAGQVARRRQTGFLPRHCRQLFGARGAWQKKTGPSPTNCRKKGSKHHVLVDAQGVPVHVILTKTNRHDVTQLLPLIDGVPPIRGKRGRPLRKPQCVQADRTYDSAAPRLALEQCRIVRQIAQRRTSHGSNPGTTRWVVERTIAWLHQFRRLRVRFERLSSIHEALLRLGCAFICWRTLQHSFCEVLLFYR